MTGRRRFSDIDYLIRHALRRERKSSQNYGRGGGGELAAFIAEQR